MEELIDRPQPRPCPFCKNPVIVERPGHRGGKFLQCSRCDATGPTDHTRDAAVERWNGYPDEPKPEPEQGCPIPLKPPSVCRVVRGLLCRQLALLSEANETAQEADRRENVQTMLGIFQVLRAEGLDGLPFSPMHFVEDGS